MESRGRSSRPLIDRFDQNLISKLTIVLTLLLVAYAYLPTLLNDYATQDQWRAFRYSISPGSMTSRANACLELDPPFYVLTGRPFVWISECVEQALVERISDFIHLRPFVLLIVLAGVISLGTALAPFLGGMAIGMICAACVVLTPGYSFMYLQGGPAAVVLLTIPLAACSYSLLRRALISSVSRLTRMLASFALFIMACMIYPAYAFVVLPIALLDLGLSFEVPLAVRLKRFFATLIHYFCASIAYYLSVKLTTSLGETLAGWHLDLTNYQVSIQLGPDVVLGRIEDAARYLYQMAPLNFDVPNGTCVLIVIIFSIWSAWLARTMRSSGAAAVVGTATLILSINAIAMFASISPWLFSKMDAISARHLLPWSVFFSGAITGLVATAVRQLPLGPAMASTAALLGVLLPVAANEHRQARLEVQVTDSEIAFFRSKLLDWVNRKGWITDRYLVVVRPQLIRPQAAQMSLNPHFGNGNAVLATSQNPVSIEWIINAVLREAEGLPDFSIKNCEFDATCANLALTASANVVLQYSDGNEVIRAPIQPYVVNVSELTSTPVSVKFERTAPLQISASSTLGNYGPEGLLLSAQPGWHAAINPSYPQTITIDFGRLKSFDEVAFEPQDQCESRMPGDVTIQISDDGNDWRTVGGSSDLCSAESVTKWHSVSLAAQQRARFARVEIHRNCGDPSLLTLRGLKFN